MGSGHLRGEAGGWGIVLSFLKAQGKAHVRRGTLEVGSWA
jgi:hypothetical protein